MPPCGWFGPWFVFPVVGLVFMVTMLQIMKCRYARGEITREQFEQMRREVA